ncbi:MAG: helix-turn-helix domain-containing protein [Planctomycetaceae bacterium]|nr:helix-turn-helix domain-containing protein [Planctomycetaceae bacterium]
MAADKKAPTGYWERRAWLRRLECSTAVKFVLLTLHEYAGNDEWAFPHQDTLAADVSLSERMVRRHLEWALSRGLLEVERTSRGNRYRIDFTWPGYNRKRYDADPAVELCAGLPTPHRGPTAGLPDSDLRSQLAEEETFGRAECGVGRPAHNTGKPHNVPSDWPSASAGSGHPRPMASDMDDRSHRSPMSGAYRTPREHPSEHPKNNQAKGVVETRMDEGEIRPDEFESLDQGERRFEQFVAANKLRRCDRLRFLTLWAYVERRRTSTEDRIGNPGGFVTDCVRRREWAGALCDEDRVRAWDRPPQAASSLHPDVTPAAVEQKPLRSLVDDYLALRAARSS